VPQNAPVSKDSMGKTETKQESSSAASAALQQGVAIHSTNSARLSFLSMWFTSLLLTYKSVTSPIVHTVASHIKTPNLKYYIHSKLYSKFINKSLCVGGKGGGDRFESASKGMCV